jgi:hypothetical protein
MHISSGGWTIKLLDGGNSQTQSHPLKMNNTQQPYPTNKSLTCSIEPPKFNQLKYP